MAKAFPHFPTGLLGAGILVIRVAAAALLAIDAVCLGPPVWMQCLAAVMALALLAGALTRVSAGLSSALVLAAAPWTPQAPWPLLALQALHILALCLTGGGAYSVDGVLFGLRIIRLPK